ncbi:MAG: right-handed parallel beta-helix repeat-containing protein [Kangiellaceae bacterium]|jgi:hypothetical protein|nr:right-handed parallel beta-helix repeat-containing protein [Kangiellaceae bacterium]
MSFKSQHCQTPHSASIRKTVFKCAAICLVLAIAMMLPITTSIAGNTYFVSAYGSDQHNGDSWATALQTIQQGLELARLGDQILIGHGTYYQDFHTVRNGKVETPIRISAVGNVEIRGAGRSRVVEINHSHIILEGIKINGKIGSGSEPESYRDKLVFVMGQDSDKGVRGVKLLNMDLRNAGGECVRLKYFAHHNEIAYSKFTNCGVWDFRFAQGGKNGEGVYIGTAPEQLQDNPTLEPDESNSNWIHDNYFLTEGNECVDIKEHASFNVVERNSCTGQKDPDSGGISIRGDRNIVRDNVIYNNVGVGIRVGGDSMDHGVNNEVIGNWLKHNGYGGLRVTRMPQRTICGNTVRPSNEQIVVGPFSQQIRLEEPCL